jgi:hypothetical protein
VIEELSFFTRFLRPLFFLPACQVARELCGGFYDLLKISLCYLLQISWALWFAAQHPLRNGKKVHSQGGL